MKIRDLDKGRYIIVYDMGKSEYSEGMTVVGKVVELEYNEDGKNTATIESMPLQRYTVTDDNYFDYWNDYMENKTERVGNHKRQSNDLQQRKRNKSKINICQLKPGDHVKVKNAKGFKKGKVVATPEVKSELILVSIRDDYDGKIFFIDNTFEIELIQRNDAVNHPSHYNYGEIEVIDFIEQVTQHYNANVAYHIGNAIKYISRAPHKNGKEDVAKAKWYIERAFENWDVK